MAATHRRGGDRLSALPDRALERILSNLVSDEAVRTSALSRRWRHVYEAVPVVDLVDTKIGVRGGSFDQLKVCFDHQVTSAILCKASTTPIRDFRLSVFHPPYDLLDQWIMTAVSSGAEELDVKLRYWDSSMRSLCPFGRSQNASEDFDQYDRSQNASGDFDEHDRNRYTKTPRQLFRTRTLRRLRLANWTLDLPRGVLVASLETLRLSRIMDPDGVLLQQLVSSCPRLADLALEECPSAREISVTSDRLQSFTMICCHKARRVVLHTRRLRSLHYKGGLPHDPSFFAVANYAGVTAVTIEICEDISSKGPREVDAVTTLISRCTNLTHLHLSLRPSMAYYSSLFTSVLRGLPGLRQLGLQGCLPTDHAIRSVAALLLNTQNLEILSLFPLAPEPSKKKRYRRPYIPDDESDIKPEDEAIHDGVDHSWIPGSLWRMYIKCLDHKLRRINIEEYEGRQLEKILAKFLLSKAAALEEISVTLADGCSPHKDEIVRELRSWRSNRRTRVTCE